MKHMNGFKRLLIILVAFSVLFTSVGASAATTYKVGKKTYRYKKGAYKVYYNSKKVSTKKHYGVMINGNIMIPYKVCLVNNGPKMKSSYNKKKKRLTLSYNGTKVRLVADKKYIYVNNVKRNIRTAPLFVKISGTNIFMIPALAVLENVFEFGYSYKEGKKAVYLTEPQKTTNSGATTTEQPTTTEAASETTEETTEEESRMTAAVFAHMNTSQFIEAMGPIAQADYHKSGVLASVTLAQAILESGWGKSTLAQSANNMFGMKTNLSGNTWSGSSWDGHSCVSIQTGEEYNGKHVTITATFRKYPTVAKSVADHSAYLVNAKNGLLNRYRGLTDTKDYKKQITIIKNGGYATSSTYVTQLTNIIERYKLYNYDK